MKYRKKPVVIEAFQMTAERMWDNRDWPEWLNRAWNEQAGLPGSLYRPYETEIGIGNCINIGTLEGPLRVSADDWIIKGVTGEIYHCKPDIFAATYEEVESGLLECCECGEIAFTISESNPSKGYCSHCDCTYLLQVNQSRFAGKV